MKLLLALLCLYPGVPAEHPCAAQLNDDTGSVTAALLECQKAQEEETPPLPGPEARKVLKDDMAEERRPSR